MRIRQIDGTELTQSSANIYADLHVANPDNLKIKSDLALQIIRAISERGLNQTEAGERMGIAQSKVSCIFRGDFSHLSERKLMECLNRLGFDIEIRLKPSVYQSGRRVLSF